MNFLILIELTESKYMDEFGTVEMKETEAKIKLNVKASKSSA